MCINAPFSSILRRKGGVFMSVWKFALAGALTGAANGFFGGGCCWIIIIILLICCCGGNWGGCGNSCGCGNNCGC